MTLPRVIPALADLTQDIAGPLPVELFRDWASGTQDLKQAEALLRSFLIEGTVVASDATGLSRLTAEADLLDVLALVSQPKEIIHALGVEIGGRAIGTWVADNTEAYYPPAVPDRHIVGAMAEAHARIAASGPVKIGMCVHRGVFYEIAGGLYGDDAEAVEHLSEQFAAPGEILMTESVASRIHGWAGMRPRAELGVVHAPGVYSLASDVRMRELGGSAINYPHPYPDDFFRQLIALRTADEPDRLRKEIYDTHLRRRTIVFVARERDLVTRGSITTLLDELVANAVMETVISHTAAARGHIASIGGGIAILNFEDRQQAVEVALATRAAFVESGVGVKIGIDEGPVLFFPTERGSSGIAGDPVNIASKICEDIGMAGKINVMQRVAALVSGLGPSEPFHATVSGVTLTGVRV